MVLDNAENPAKNEYATDTTGKADSTGRKKEEKETVFWPWYELFNTLKEIKWKINDNKLHRSSTYPQWEETTLK